MSVLDAARLRAHGAGLRASFHEAAGMSRTSADFLPALLSADLALAPDLRTIRARSRHLAANNPHVAGFLQTLKDNVIGWKDEGVSVQAQMRGPTGDLLGDFNRGVELAWRTWGESASLDGQDGIGDLERMAIGLLPADGEALFRIHRGADNPFAYALEPIDPDCLDETLTEDQPGRNPIRMGVELDRRTRRPVAYWLWSEHPADLRVTRRERVRVPAAEIRHVFVKLRPNQTRGLPWLAPVVMTARQLDRYLEAEVMQARVAAATGGFFTATGEQGMAYLEALNKPTADQDQTVPDRLTMPVEPGVFRQLPPGLDFKPWDPKAPNSNFADFQKAILRTIACGLPVSYETLAKDLREVNYGSLRGGSILERDGWRALQRLIGRKLVTPTYREWLAMASLSGQVRLPTEEASRWTAHKCQFRGWQWVDPLNDIQAFERRMRLGLASPVMACDELGLDFEDIVDEIAYCQEYAEARGVDISGTDAPTVAATPDGDSGRAPARRGADDAEDDTQRADARLRVMPGGAR